MRISARRDSIDPTWLARDADRRAERAARLDLAAEIIAEAQAEQARRARMSEAQRLAEDAHLERDANYAGREWAAGGPVYRYEGWPS